MALRLGGPRRAQQTEPLDAADLAVDHAAAAGEPPARPPWGWRQSLFGVRSRIVLGMVALLVIVGVATVFILRQILIARQDERIATELRQEVSELRQLIGGVNPDGTCVSDQNADGECDVGRDPATGEPFGDDIATVFTTYLRRSLPLPDETIVTFLAGEPYQLPAARPLYDLTTDPRFLALGDITTPHTGDIETEEVGTVRYLAVPVENSADEPVGVFLAAKFVDVAREELDTAVRIAAQVALGMVVVGSLLAFAATGQMLAPLRTMTSTAQSISESDLTRRIQVAGGDELSTLARTFNAMLDRLETAFTSQRDFIDDAGHELRTPITIVSGHLQLLPDEPEERRQTVALVEDELGRMSRIVDDLLVLAKVERPDFLSLQTVDLDILTAELHSKARALADRQWRLEHTGHAPVVMDRQRVTQAMMQLAQNAVQHTTTGDVIALGTSMEGGEVRLWVRDTGPGVPPELADRIFERFARGHDGRRRSEGAGLGLAIVRAIAQAHGGQVELHSPPGEGATFTLVLPAEGPHVPARESGPGPRAEQ